MCLDVSTAQRAVARGVSEEHTFRTLHHSLACAADSEEGVLDVTRHFPHFSSDRIKTITLSTKGWSMKSGPPMLRLRTSIFFKMA